MADSGPEGAAGSTSCPRCGSQVAAALLSCPNCQRLVHAERLKTLSTAAREAEETAPERALELWNEAQSLLPPGSKQHGVVAGKIASLEQRLGPDASAKIAERASGEKKGVGKKLIGGLGAAGALGLLLWKLKFILAFALGKLKFLALGLTKASTFFSMFLALGVYWVAFGWKFALGLVVSIYIHEMGHVASLRRHGIRASAPMFIPGLGAVVRLKDYPKSPGEDARVGLAGPLWGLAAALGAYLVYLAVGWPAWGAIARVGAWINLFNLLPVWQLDGGRAFRALSRSERWIACAALLLAWILTSEGMLLLLLLLGGAAALFGKAAATPDRGALARYLVLVAALSWLTTIQVAGVGR